MEHGNKKLRHELKYFINNYEYSYLKKRLEFGMNKDKNSVIDEGYHVRSLYFDDIYDSAFNEKEWGIFKRKKYRIRIYNVSDCIIKLEKKSKYGQYIRKDTVNITKDRFYMLVDGEHQLESSDNELLRELYIEKKTRLLRPTVIVDYDREAYISEAGNVRITFDKNLRACINSYDIFDDKIATKTVFSEPKMIMEIKYDSFLPTHIRNLIQICNHNISQASKYVMCRKAISSFA